MRTLLAVILIVVLVAVPVLVISGQLYRHFTEEKFVVGEVSGPDVRDVLIEPEPEPEPEPVVLSFYFYDGSWHRDNGLDPDVEWIGPVDCPHCHAHLYYESEAIIPCPVCEVWVHLFPDGSVQHFNDHTDCVEDDFDFDGDDIFSWTY